MFKSVIDVFAHVLPPKFYQQLLQLAPELPQKYPFIKIPALSELAIRQAHFEGRVKQVISNVNLDPGDYTDPILAIELAKAFKKFYVDTALLVKHKALELAVDYYGSDHVLFGTDAPWGSAPVGPTKEITATLQQANLTSKEREQIIYLNFEKLMAGDAK